jgi:hypothetical protein
MDDVLGKLQAAHPSRGNDYSHSAGRHGPTCEAAEQVAYDALDTCNELHALWK